MRALRSVGWLVTIVVGASACSKASPPRQDSWGGAAAGSTSPASPSSRPIPLPRPPGLADLASASTITIDDSWEGMSGRYASVIDLVRDGKEFAVKATVTAAENSAVKAGRVDAGAVEQFLRTVADYDLVDDSSPEPVHTDDYPKATVTVTLPDRATVQLSIVNNYRRWRCNAQRLSLAPRGAAEAGGSSGVHEPINKAYQAMLEAIGVGQWTEEVREHEDYRLCRVPDGAAWVTRASALTIQDSSARDATAPRASLTLTRAGSEFVVVAHARHGLGGRAESRRMPAAPVDRFLTTLSTETADPHPSGAPRGVGRPGDSAIVTVSVADEGSTRDVALLKFDGQWQCDRHALKAPRFAYGQPDRYAAAQARIASIQAEVSDAYDAMLTAAGRTTWIARLERLTESGVCDVPYTLDKAGRHIAKPGCIEN